MVPGLKTGRRKKLASGNNASTSATSAHDIAMPLTFSDETQPLNDTQIVVEETHSHGVGNATPTTNELGLQIRWLCPLKGVKSWNKIDQSIKDVVQVVLDKFDIGEDFHSDEQAQEIVDRKAYLLYKDWRYNLKQYFLELEEEGVNDPYSHLPVGVCLDDWKHMIDVAWKDESHLVGENGELDFLKFYAKSHKSKKTNEWIHPKCGELHDEMVNLQVAATEVRTPLTQEELSWQVLV
ncbi:hypothetical protein ACSBR1_015807 [Camellia fascicularis]